MVIEHIGGVLLSVYAHIYAVRLRVGGRPSRDVVLLSAYAYTTDPFVDSRLGREIEHCESINRIKTSYEPKRVTDRPIHVPAHHYASTLRIANVLTFLPQATSRVGSFLWRLWHPEACPHTAAGGCHDARERKRSLTLPKDAAAVAHRSP